jgi:hypothetical protein
MIKERLYYWISMAIMAIFFILLYSQYLDLEQVLDDSHRKFNRQLSVIDRHWLNTSLRKDEKINLLEKQMIELEERHKQEIGECVEFYTTALEEAKNDKRNN